MNIFKKFWLRELKDVIVQKIINTTTVCEGWLSIHIKDGVYFLPWAVIISTTVRLSFMTVTSPCVCAFHAEYPSACSPNYEEPVYRQMVAEHVRWVFTAYFQQLLCSVALKHSFVWHDVGLRQGHSLLCSYFYTSAYGVTWDVWSRSCLWARQPLIWSAVPCLSFVTVRSHRVVSPVVCNKMTCNIAA